GNLYLMFEQKTKAGSRLAEFESLELGQEFKVRDESLEVTEKAIAKVSAAEGEIPWAVRPGLSHTYADLKSKQGSIGTLDFSEATVRFYFGSRVTLDAIGITAESNLGIPQEISVQGIQVNCPNCAGSLQMKLPDQSLRITCPSCNALLDVREGDLVYLDSLGPKKHTPVLPLGSKGVLFGKEFIVIGFLKRFVFHAGKSYPWSEYLLYNPEVKFRWLVATQDHHWSYIEQIDYPGSTQGSIVHYDTKFFKLYDDGTSTVSYVVGEFPWRVQIGEQTKVKDYISPPLMLSFEQSIAQTDSADPYAVINSEVTVSKGTYVSADEIEKGFSLKEMRRPLGVGAIQPAPVLGYRFLVACGAFLVALMILRAIGGRMHPGNPPDGWLMTLAIWVVIGFPIGALLYQWSFELKRWQGSDFSPYLGLNQAKQNFFGESS
ncbi:MAG: DUF4178 domain-containing protein, partial [Planctomycetes bacterium]|nr:DUF4178 domain-containing protein [Planctomycetota bacterium]